MILVPFCVWEGARVWAHWNHSFHVHLHCQGPVSGFLHPKFPSPGAAAAADGLVATTSLVLQKETFFWSIIIYVLPQRTK